jgi:hypothetical protein
VPRWRRRWRALLLSTGGHPPRACVAIRFGDRRAHPQSLRRGKAQGVRERCCLAGWKNMKMARRSVPTCARSLGALTSAWAYGAPGERCAFWASLSGISAGRRSGVGWARGFWGLVVLVGLRGECFGVRFGGCVLFVGACAPPPVAREQGPDQRSRPCADLPLHKADARRLAGPCVPSSQMIPRVGVTLIAVFFPGASIGGWGCDALRILAAYA